MRATNRMVNPAIIEQYINMLEVHEDYDPQEVADAFVEELDSWITYHQKSAAAYELIRESLRKRVCEA